MRMRRRDDTAPPPVFLFGFERSGNTLLAMMVGAHPRLAVPFTVTGLWYRYGRMLERYDSLRTKAAVERLVDDLRHEERIRLWDVKLERKDLLDGLQPGNYPDVIERFHVLYARQKGKDYWGNADIATLDDMDMANAWFPSAKFIHIVRDGRDVALSHETMPYGASNTLECAQRWANRVTTNLKMGAILGSGRYMMVRYEDLVLESQATLTKVCDFIGVRFSMQMLEHSKVVEEIVPKDRLWLWPELSNPPVKSKAYGWKKKMTVTKRVIFERNARDVLRNLGYETYDRVPKYPVAYALEFWQFMGRGGRFRRLANKLPGKRKSKLERAWQKSRDPASGSKSYVATQEGAFGALVEDGSYDTQFEHSPAMKDFVATTLLASLSAAELTGPMAVLDCGCGPGAWLAYLWELLDGSGRQRHRLFGFDITPAMIDVARRRLATSVPPQQLQVGDIMEDQSYAFDGADKQFHVIFAYDVIQQLPRRLQLDACKSMLRHLATGGVALIFDHDSLSAYGVKMGFRKLVTKYLGIGLVPAYYCNARYPPLGRFARAISEMNGFLTEVKKAGDGRKRVLIIRSVTARTI
jgi:SAM-dependent methyltransferase